MEGANQPSGSVVFKLLAEPVREGLAELGFSEPTLPQIMAFPPVLRGENVLLIAPTGSGKTEAVLLPIFSQLVQQPKREGISVIYVTPLRALNRDMLKRLTYWAKRLGISIEVRHGDTDMKLRRRQAVSPPDMLVTTPETMQAILPGSRMREHLSHVRYVVVDEVHELAESKRGAQLTVVLERLLEVTRREFQRIGLSATVGNPDEVAKFLAGTGRPIKIVQTPLSKGCRYSVETPNAVEADYDLAGKLRTSPEAAARVRRIMELVDSHRSTLIFVNSRENAETLGHKFTQLERSDIAVHHGSLSREERTLIEDDFKAGRLRAIICTSTLELGIDVGRVDLVVQYLSPRQVSSLIQRVGRSGHSLDRLPEGIIITAYPDDTLESIAAMKNAMANRLEPVLMHEEALDVLAHQIAGVVMDKDTVRVGELLALLRRAYPYRNVSEDRVLDVIDFLDGLDEVTAEQEGRILRKTKRTRKYYFENLSMIPDEKRYPMISVITDRKIGTVGDEFMAIRARLGLNVIVRGKVWRIVQIEEETGTVFVVPSEDPFAAAPGWDGEMMALPFDLASRTGEMRGEIAKALMENADVEKATEQAAARLGTEKRAITEAVKEVAEHLKQGAPLPTQNHIVIEAFDKYLIVHASFGELVNRTFGGIFDAVLSDRDTITGWWNDGYRILIETLHKVTQRELGEMPGVLFGLSGEEAKKAFNAYLEAKFPFSYKMKFVADRFGALPRGKTMSYERLSQLPARFRDTPIYDEALREGMMEKTDLKKATGILKEIREGTVKVSTVLRTEKPTPLAFHILEKFSDVSELMAPEEVLQSNIEKMKMAIEARRVNMLCMQCGTATGETRIKSLPEQLQCSKCASRLLAPLYPSEDTKRLTELMSKRTEDKELAEEELRDLVKTRRMADLVLSYGRKAVVALEVKGVGPETASRILGKMHPKEDQLYMDLLKAKIQYLKTKPYWESREKHSTNP